MGSSHSTNRNSNYSNENSSDTNIDLIDQYPYKYDTNNVTNTKKSGLCSSNANSNTGDSNVSNITSEGQRILNEYKLIMNEYNLEFKKLQNFLSLYSNYNQSFRLLFLQYSQQIMSEFSTMGINGSHLSSNADQNSVRENNASLMRLNELVQRLADKKSELSRDNSNLIPSFQFHTNQFSYYTNKMANLNPNNSQNYNTTSNKNMVKINRNKLKLSNSSKEFSYFKQKILGNIGSIKEVMAESAVEFIMIQQNLIKNPFAHLQSNTGEQDSSTKNQREIYEMNNDKLRNQRDVELENNDGNNYNKEMRGIGGGNSSIGASGAHSGMIQSHENRTEITAGNPSGDSREPFGVPSAVNVTLKGEDIHVNKITTNERIRFEKYLTKSIKYVQIETFRENVRILRENEIGTANKGIHHSSMAGNDTVAGGAIVDRDIEKGNKDEYVITINDDTNTNTTMGSEQNKSISNSLNPANMSVPTDSSGMISDDCKEITLYQEVPVITKKLVPVERVIIHKDIQYSTYKVEGDVLREKAEIIYSDYENQKVAVL